MRQRYCSESCRAGARKWLRWKAQQRYRRSVGGKQKRNGQNQRYRERVKARELPEPAAVVTENSVRAENAVVPSIREILVVSR